MAVQQVAERVLVGEGCGGELVGHPVDPRAHAQVVLEVGDLGDQQLDRPLPLQAEHRLGGGGGDVGVAVPVTAHPGAEPDRRMGGVHLPADGFQGGRYVVEQVGHGLPDRLADVVEDGPCLVERVGSLVADLVGLPDRLDQFLDPPVHAAEVSLGTTVLAALLDELGDSSQLLQDRPPGCLGGVCGEYRP